MGTLSSMKHGLVAVSLQLLKTDDLMALVSFGVLTIYMENPEIPVGKSNGTHHSIWSTSEILGSWSKWCIFIAPFGIYSCCSYILHVIHLLLRQAKSFHIYAKNFHPGG